MDFSKVKYGFIKIDIWSFLGWLHGFVKFVTCICWGCSMYSRPLPNKPKLKFDQDFKACQRLCFELKVLIEWVIILKALGPLCLWQCVNICLARNKIIIIMFFFFSILTRHLGTTSSVLGCRLGGAPRQQQLDIVHKFHLLGKRSITTLRIFSGYFFVDSVVSLPPLWGNLFCRK